MADTTKDIWNDNDGEEEEQPRRGRGLRRFLIFLLVLVLVLGVVVIAAWRDGTGLDALHRLVASGGGESGDQTVVYDYDASSQNRFALAGDSLTVLSGSSARLLQKNGEELWSAPVKMTAPAVDACGGRTVAYDVGGTELYVLEDGGLVYRLEDEDLGNLIAANLNAKGWLAVTAEQKGCKGVVAVYNGEGQKVFAFRSSERFVMDAYVTDDCTTLAAVTLGQEEGTFVSSIVLYDLKEKDPKARYAVSGGLVLDIGQQGDRLVTVSDTGLSFAGTKGELQASYSYGSAYLRGYDFGGEDFTVLQLNRYRSGSLGRLVTVAPDGTEIASLEVRDEILSVSAAGRYVAVLYTDRLVIYNRDLQQYAALNGTGSAREALVRTDGTVVLLGSDEGELYLP